jgi:hypothetical protein
MDKPGTQSGSLSLAGFATRNPINPSVFSVSRF